MEMSSPSTSRKRRRDEGEEESPQMSSPEAKRLLLDILDDDADAEAEAGDQDVTSVMKSLEEEMALPSPPPPPHVPPQDAAVSDPPDLGYLFEASDDELGLPPPAPSSSGDGSEAYDEEEGIGFGQIWGFDDDLSGYDGFELGIRAEAEAEDVVVFDGDLFDYGDATTCWVPEFADISWRSETLPAV